MKKLFALLTLAALLMTAFVCPTLAESPMTGGWSAYTDDPTEIPAEARDALNAALEELVGCVYKPVALLATQVVAGTNYYLNKRIRALPQTVFLAAAPVFLCCFHSTPALMPEASICLRISYICLSVRATTSAQS